MTVRQKWFRVAVPVLALAVSGCVTDVTQEASPSMLRARFDSTAGVIPTPNDFALQAAMGQPAGATRTALEGSITAGGFPGGGPNALNAISVPFEFVSEGVGTTATVWGDPTTINSTTVAIVKVRGAGAPAVLDPTALPTSLGRIQAFPAAGYEAGARYVVAVRGGPNGVKASDGRTFEASTPIYLITHGVNFASPETRPATLTPDQAASLQKVQGLLGAAVDWGHILNDGSTAGVPAGAGAATCAAILGVAAAAFAEGQCWVPYASAAVPGFPGDPPTKSALAAVALAFPVTEAISISTFEIAP
ncbi:MAG TPA: hypothetical protein VF875_05125 [Anaeromyxobacter sp.]